MAAHVAYDTDKRIIYVTTAPTNGVVTLDAQVDIYSDMKEDWRTDANLGKHKFPLSEPVGGNPITQTKSVSPYYFLKYGWYMRPYEADHTLYIENGYLLIQGGGDPWLKTLGGYTVNVRDSIPADSFALTAQGNITEQDKDDIADKSKDAVWDEPLTGVSHNIPTSAGRRLRQLGDIISAEVVDPSATVISFITDLTQVTDDWYNDQLVRFITGNLIGIVRPILSYNGSTKTITITEDLPFAPDDGSEFDIIPTHIHPIEEIADGVWDKTLP